MEADYRIQIYLKLEFSSAKHDLECLNSAYGFRN